MEISTPGSSASERTSKRRMISASRSAPASPRDLAAQDADVLFEASFSRPTKSPDSAQKSNSATPRTARAQVSSPRIFHPDASLVLVGIRGCGKRSLGFIAATALGRRFVTEDHFFQAVTGVSRQDFLRTYGSQQFHQKDIEISRRMLDENKFNCVIECGLGSLTTSVQDHLRAYCQTNPVVHLVRDMNDIKQLLKLSDRSTRMLEQGDASHRRCSNFEYFNLLDNSAEEPAENGTADRLSPAYSFKLKEVKEDFSSFARFVTGAARSRPDEDSPFSLSEIPVDRRLYSHALEVKLSWYQNGKVDFSRLESGGDVVEVLVDQWSSRTMVHLSRMVADVRRRMAVPLLISAQRGVHGIGDGEYALILEHALRLGVEFLAIELDFDPQRITSVVAAKGHTRIIGQFVDFRKEPDGWENDSWLTVYTKAERLRCDIVRLFKRATSREDNEMLSRFTHKIRGRVGLSPPVIAYNVGPLGKTSQIFNHILTSVTHPHLEAAAGLDERISRPQISSKEAVQALFSSFVLDPLRFYILGGSVSYSLSPAMHNAAYRLLGMEHLYATKDIARLDELDTLAQDPNLGGVAVVQPFKILAMAKVSSKSRHAEVIGAANTLLPLHSNNGVTASLQIQANQRNRAGTVIGWHGENTDWIGITVCLTRSLSPRNVISMKTASLVIGAGGMARSATYALLKMGCNHVFVYNRAKANADTLAAHFNAWIVSRGQLGDASARVRVLTSTTEAWPADYARPTMIVSCVNEETTSTKTAANFQVPGPWLTSPTGGVIIEMAYNNTNTSLIQQVRLLQKESTIPWVLVTGIEVLPEQAIAQFELMTGRKAPRSTMRQAIAEQIKSRQ